MSVLSWIKRRTLSRYADDKAVNDFTRVVEQKRSAFDAATEDAERDRKAFFDLIEKATGERPPEI